MGLHRESLAEATYIRQQKYELIDGAVRRALQALQKREDANPNGALQSEIRTQLNRPWPPTKVRTSLERMERNGETVSTEEQRSNGQTQRRWRLVERM